MKTAPELLQERTNRILTAIALEKPDKVPVVLFADGFCAKHLGITLAELIRDVNKSSDYILESLLDLGDIDGTMVTVAMAAATGAIALSDCKLPGRELKDNDLWQVDEKGLMTAEDYDTIIDKGWNYFFADFLQNRVPKAWADFNSVMSADIPGSIMKFANSGIPLFMGSAVCLPFDNFCCGRGMAKFMSDVRKMPDKVQAAADVAMVDMMANVKNIIGMAKPITYMLGAPRSAGEFISPKIWNRFVGPYVQQAVSTIVDAGSHAYLHFDANWERDLEFFKTLPKAKCIFGSDHATDIFKIKEVLGDHMCILGDVPPAMLTLGTPDDVYNYSTRLIKEIGPSGFILAAACTIPANAKVENVKAMIAAASGK